MALLILMIYVAEVILVGVIFILIFEQLVKDAEARYGPRHELTISFMVHLASVYRRGPQAA